MTMLDYIQEEQSVLLKILNEFDFESESLATTKNLLILATGSSYNACLAAKVYMESIAPIYVDIQEPYNFRKYGKLNPIVDNVLAVSQSGKSTSTIDAIQNITTKAGISTTALTSDLKSPITSYVKNTIDINMGIEKVGFVTKGYSATVLNLYLIGLKIAVKQKVITKIKLEQELEKIINLVNKIPEIIKLSEEFYMTYQDILKSYDRYIGIGYGPNWGTAKEFETKFTETVRVPSQGFELEAYMHGPYLEADATHCMFFIDYDLNAERSHKLRHYLADHVGHTFSISTGTSTDETVLGLGLRCEEALTPLVTVIPIQYLSYKIATDRGIDLNKRIFDDFDTVLNSKVIEN